MTESQSATLAERSAKVMGEGAPMFYDEPVELIRGEGVWLHAADGTRYLDLYNNVPCVGHSNPRVADALAKQAATLNVHSRYLHRSVVEYVERLVGLHHDGIESAILACSGSEATELALALARSSTGKNGIIGTDATYHGNTPGIAKLSRLPVGEDRGNVRSIATPQLFRPLVPGVSEDQLCELHLDQLRTVIGELESSGTGFAGLMICSILANEGLPNVPAGWFEQAIQIVRNAGGLVIADEVQAGFGRSGDWWGYETNDFAPDIVCMGKPMGNGLPVSAVATTHERISNFRQSRFYFNTFAASPLQAAAGMAVIDEIVDRDLVQQASTVGAMLLARLQGLAADFPRMGDVRGVGLFIGIDWVTPGTTEPDVAGAAQMVEGLKRRNMLLGKAGQHRNVLKIRPPLVFDETHAGLFLDALSDAVADAHR